MEQLGQLRDIYADFKRRHVEIIAISIEERTFMPHLSVLGNLDYIPEYPLLCDPNWESTPRYERTTAYFVDEQGVVQQVFPMEIYDRPPWEALLNEIDALDAARGDAGK